MIAAVPRALAALVALACLAAPLAAVAEEPAGRAAGGGLNALAPKAAATSPRAPAMSGPGETEARSDAGAGAADTDLPLDALALRAEAGDPAAQYRLGLHLLHRGARPEDTAAGLAWLRRAAAQNHAGAHYQLGLMYLTGDGVEADIAEAHAHLRVAARHGDPRARAMLFYVGQRMNQAEHGRAANRARQIDDGAAAK